MISMIARLGTMACAVALLSSARPAAADTFTYDLNTRINGDVAAGLARATIADVSADTVRLTLDLRDMPSSQFVGTFLFNFNGTQAALDALGFSYEAGLSMGGPAAQSIGRTLDGFGNNNTPGFGSGSSGLFDIQFTFATSNAGGGVQRLQGGETTVYTITGTGLTAAAFNVTGASPFNAQGPYFIAAHIQGIQPSGSGAYGANTVQAVPEPSSAILACCGLAGVVALGVRRRRRS